VECGKLFTPLPPFLHIVERKTFCGKNQRESGLGNFFHKSTAPITTSKSKERNRRKERE
jgi:hypothetical protein